MNCNYLRDQETGRLVAILCGARKRAQRCAASTSSGQACGEPSRFQCDWKIGGGKTCDKHLCAKCAKEVRPEKHLCPDHLAAYRQWLESRPTNHDQRTTD